MSDDLGFVPCQYGCANWVHPNPSNPDARQSVRNHLCLNKAKHLAEIAGLLSLKPRVIFCMCGAESLQAIGRVEMEPGNPLSLYQFVVTVGRLR
jgi:hypothetical protein